MAYSRSAQLKEMASTCERTQYTVMCPALRRQQEVPSLAEREREGKVQHRVLLIDKEGHPAAMWYKWDEYKATCMLHDGLWKLVSCSPRAQCPGTCKCCDLRALSEFTGKEVWWRVQLLYVLCGLWLNTVLCTTGASFRFEMVTVSFWVCKQQFLCWTVCLEKRKLYVVKLKEGEV